MTSLTVPSSGPDLPRAGRRGLHPQSCLAGPPAEHFPIRTLTASNRVCKTRQFLSIFVRTMIALQRPHSKGKDQEFGRVPEKVGLRGLEGVFEEKNAR